MEANGGGMFLFMEVPRPALLKFVFFSTAEAYYDIWTCICIRRILRDMGQIQENGSNPEYQHGWHWTKQRAFFHAV